MNLPLIFIGLLGAGKSSVGKQMASALAWDFYDSDLLFEQQVEQPITSFFAEQGEKKFREIESAILADLVQNKKRVVATGGGVVLDAGNRALINKKSLCIYLDADVDTLYQRLKDDCTRPLLQNTDLRQRLQDLKTQREAYYRECAHITVSIKDKSIEQIIAEIKEKLK